MRVSLKNKPVKDGGDFSIIPTGRYDLMITKAEERTATTSGNQYISVEFSIMNDDESESYKGRKVWANLNGNDVGLSILKSILVFNQSPLADLEDENFEASALVGMKVNGKIGTEKGQNDEPRNNVKWFKPVDEKFAATGLDYFTPAEKLADPSASSFSGPIASPFA
jgi:hypothetical protein